MHPLNRFASGLGASLLVAAGMGQECGEEMQCVPQNHQNDFLVLFTLISKVQWTFYAFWALTVFYISLPWFIFKYERYIYPLIGVKLIYFVFLG